MWKFIHFFKLKTFCQQWMYSHAQLPTPLIISNNKVRVFFATRDKNHHSHIGFVDLLINGKEVSMEQVSKKPVLSPGSIGFFDEHGVYPSCIIRDSNRWLMFYVGWNKGAEPPMFYASIGVAASNDSKVFQRLSCAPFLSRSPFDPWMVTSPTIFTHSNRCLMAYTSGLGWIRCEDGSLQSLYHIKLAEKGESLLDWKRNGLIAINLSDNETNIARPTVTEVKNGVLGMWFSYVSKNIGKYRIGCAESLNGIEWLRNDSASGISEIPEFANEMMCYPSVFQLSGERWLLVNGNGNGKEGFAIAHWSNE